MYTLSTTNLLSICGVFQGTSEWMAVTSASQTSVLQSGSLIEDVSPGEVILKKLFAQFVASSDTKLKFIATQKQV